MKKAIFIIFVALVLSISFCACGNNTISKPKDNSSMQTDDNNALSNPKDDSSTHTDEIKIVSHEIKTDSLSDDFFEIKYKIKNISNEQVTFEGISMIEYDNNNDILDSYQSYNKASKEVDLEPNQSMYLELTFSKEDGITKIKNDKYSLTIDGEEIDGVFSEPYIVNVNY